MNHPRGLQPVRQAAATASRSEAGQRWQQEAVSGNADSEGLKAVNCAAGAGWQGEAQCIKEASPGLQHCRHQLSSSATSREIRFTRQPLLATKSYCRPKQLLSVVSLIAGSGR